MEVLLDFKIGRVVLNSLFAKKYIYINEQKKAAGAETFSKSS